MTVRAILCLAALVCVEARWGQGGAKGVKYRRRAERDVQRLLWGLREVNCQAC